MYVNEVLWFFMLYVIAAYIRLYPDCRLNHKRAGIILFAGCFVMMLLSTAAFDVLRNVWVFADYQTHFFAGKTSFAMGAAIGLLIIFLNVKPFYNKVINVVGGCTFGVYLIHDNNYVRPFLWNTVFRNTDFADSNILILHMVFAVVAVFVACTAMEWCRKKFVERIYANKISEI
jgi:heme A synthase